jgi:serine/threonine-protein kinase
MLVKGATIPTSQDLPESLMNLVQRHAVELSDTRWPYDTRKLINVLKKISGIEGKPVADPIPTKPVTRGQRRGRFEDLGEVIVDHRTGLMWQRSGSSKRFWTIKGAEKYIEQLNRERFAGYADWRLPTFEELMSLRENLEQSNGLHINPIFDRKQVVCWARSSSGSACYLDFASGLVDCYIFNFNNYVRAVRA